MMWAVFLACGATATTAEAQMGQAGMAPAGGMVNQAFSRFQDFNNNGPGWFYYGINAADRGLGYRGSYMTVGGYVPYAEDGLGGLWSADLRGHLSNYGGFFSNVGMVRKQFIGGTLLGVGVFWDYDGDLNQYGDTTITDPSGSYVFAGGQAYQQVGVSGEWLTDWGALRSNGYIPCGSTGELMGPFVGNSLLSQNGINAALGGTDLEVGAYIPGLSDWAGMISVGGYAYGNSKYETIYGKALVPWFGGVYTRLDVSLMNNWDFSLQANNDSYFDWTGFARLTYRMGGSRRRNVPDQMEQPMMRNEHVVRAHQAPQQALIPDTAAARAAGVALKPYYVIHVDNTPGITTSAAGTQDAPLATLTEAHALATNPYDIVFVHYGDSANCAYEVPAGGWTFNANNQYLVGQGTGLMLCTANAGNIALWTPTPTGTYPTITNATPGEAAVVLTDSSNPAIAGTTSSATVDHIQIQGASIGISDGGGLPVAGVATANDVRIIGDGLNQRGVQIRDLANGEATLNFTHMYLDALTDNGFDVDGTFGAPKVNIVDSQIVNTGGSGGSAVYVNNLYNPGRVSVVNTLIDETSWHGIYAKNAELFVDSSIIRNSCGAGVYAEDNSIVQVVDSTFSQNDIGIQGSANSAGATLNITANCNTISTKQPGNGIVLATPSPANGAVVRAYLVANDIKASLGGNGGDDILLFCGNPAGEPGTSDLFLKAADVGNLRALNGNATVRQVYPFSTTTVPAPPNFDPTLVIPLPAP